MTTPDDDGSTSIRAAAPSFLGDFHGDLGQLVDHTERTLRRLFAGTRLMSDLPADVTVEEVDAQIAAAKGQSITVFVQRGALSKLKIVIPQHAATTVLHLKKAIRRRFELTQQRERRRRRRERERRERRTPTTPHDDSSSGDTSRKHRDAAHQSTASHRRDRDSSASSASSSHSTSSTSRDHRTTTTTEQQHANSVARISWRHVWRTYWLDLDGVRLTDDRTPLAAYGVRNKCVLSFVRQQKPKRSNRRQQQAV